MKATVVNPELLREWVAVLRSNKYDQGKGELKTPQGAFCCLGVLCEVGVKHEIIPPPVMEDESWYYENGATAYPPDSMTRAVFNDNGYAWSVRVPLHLRLKYADASQPIDTDEMAGLAGLNDGPGLTFSEIAECIEFTYPEVFGE